MVQTKGVVKRMPRIDAYWNILLATKVLPTFNTLPRKNGLYHGPFYEIENYVKNLKICSISSPIGLYIRGVMGSTKCTSCTSLHFGQYNSSARNWKFGKKKRFSNWAMLQPFTKLEIWEKNENFDLGNISGLFLDWNFGPQLPKFTIGLKGPVFRLILLDVVEFLYLKLACYTGLT